MPDSNTEFDHETNTWVATSMPKDIPDKREDVRFLEIWLTERSVSNLFPSLTHYFLVSCDNISWNSTPIYLYFGSIDSQN